MKPAWIVDLTYKEAHDSPKDTSCGVTRLRIPPCPRIGGVSKYPKFSARPKMGVFQQSRPIAVTWVSPTTSTKRAKRRPRRPESLIIPARACRQLL